MQESKKARTERQEEILHRLEAHYGDAKPALHFRSPFELLIAVMLSAQCTDVRVNLVTNELFKSYNTPETILTLSQPELKEKIRSCGLSETKSKNILATCHRLLSEFSGEVPGDIDSLQTLPGVGRKTANVVASVAFGVPAIAVDTHVFRVSNRLGLAQANTVEKTEKQLMEVIPKDTWSRAHHWLIWFGRQVCAARRPKCESCFLSDVCADWLGLRPAEESAVKSVNKSKK
jgi:endonuclease III